ncbi:MULTISPECIES: hypothetical protein [unclassified Streptomyces]|uniref:hypothetical protein n=1 Tax=Streptomyces sp. NPDC058441 TaxID=3346502 RepID=UPI00366471DB
MSGFPEPAVRLEVHAREPCADGHRFDGTGAYEVLTATAHYSVAPEAPAHRAVPDLGLAPRDGTGRVRFSGDVEILRPVDRGRRRLFFDWGNRGNKRACSTSSAPRSASRPSRSSCRPAVTATPSADSTRRPGP